MAEQTFKGLLQLNSKPYAVAQSENKVLRAGEPLAVTITGDDESSGETVTMLKIGDGSTAFNDLPWLSGLASDVYDWALQPEKPKYSITEINKYITGGGVSFQINTNASSLYSYGLLSISDDNFCIKFSRESELADDMMFDLDCNMAGQVNIEMSDNLKEALKEVLEIKATTNPNDITATAENQIMLSDSSNKFQAVNLVGTDYSTIRPRGIRIVGNVSEASGTPEGCFSAVIGG